MRPPWGAPSPDTFGRVHRNSAGPRQIDDIEELGARRPRWAPVRRRRQRAPTYRSHRSVAHRARSILGAMRHIGVEGPLRIPRCSTSASLAWGAQGRAARSTSPRPKRCPPQRRPRRRPCMRRHRMGRCDHRWVVTSQTLISPPSRIFVGRPYGLKVQAGMNQVFTKALASAIPSASTNRTALEWTPPSEAFTRTLRQEAQFNAT